MEKKSFIKNVKGDVKAGARIGLIVFSIGLAIDLVGWVFGDFDEKSPKIEKPTESE